VSEILKWRPETFQAESSRLLHNSIIRQEMLQLRSEVMNMKSLLTEAIHCGDRYSKIKYYYQ